MTDYNELKSDYTDVHAICREGWSGYLSQAATDLDYYCLAQHTEEEATAADEQDRILHTIDKVGRQVNLLSGYEIRNRHILKIGPQGLPDQQEDDACRQHTLAIMSLMSLHGGYNALSMAFKWGTLIEGSNLIEIYRDRLGDLQYARLGYNQFLLNPGLTKTDLSDCDDILTGRWLSEDKIKSLLPTESDRIDDIKPLNFSERWDYLGSPPLGNKEQKRLYEEWWSRKTEYVDTVISRLNGQEIPLKEFANKFFNGDLRFAKRKVSELTLPNGAPALSRYSKPVDKVKLTCLVDGEVVWTGDNPLKAGNYNFVWVHGDFCAEHSRDELKLQSFVRRLRDPQRAFNRRINQIYDIIESQIQGLRTVRSKYLMNPEDTYKTGQGIVLHAKPDFPDNLPLSELIHQQAGSEVPQSLFAALEATDKAETEAGGLNEEIFGSDDKDIPGILSRYRTGQALTGQQGMFESYRESKRDLGMKLVRLCQLNYTPDRIADMINEMPVPSYYSDKLTKYDCSPIEGLLTDSQQELFYAELKSIRALYPEAASMIPLSELLRYSPTPFRKEFLNMIKRSEQQQAQILQQQLQDKRRMDAVMEAQMAEDIAQAEESRTGAALDRAKTMTEIQKLNDEPYLEVVKMAMDLEKARMTKKQTVKAKK